MQSFRVLYSYRRSQPNIAFVFCLCCLNFIEKKIKQRCLFICFMELPVFRPLTGLSLILLRNNVTRSLIKTSLHWKCIIHIIRCTICKVHMHCTCAMVIVLKVIISEVIVPKVVIPRVIVSFFRW